MNALLLSLLATAANLNYDLVAYTSPGVVISGQIQTDGRLGLIGTHDLRYAYMTVTGGSGSVTWQPLYGWFTDGIVFAMSDELLLMPKATLNLSWSMGSPVYSQDDEIAVTNHGDGTCLYDAQYAVTGVLQYEYDLCYTAAYSGSGVPWVLATTDGSEKLPEVLGAGGVMVFGEASGPVSAGRAVPEPDDYRLLLGFVVFVLVFGIWHPFPNRTRSSGHVWLEPPRGDPPSPPPPPPPRKR